MKAILISFLTFLLVFCMHAQGTRKEVNVISGLAYSDTNSISFLKKEIQNLKERKIKKLVYIIDLPQELIFLSENLKFSLLEEYFEIEKNSTDNKIYNDFILDLISERSDNEFLIGSASIVTSHTIDRIKEVYPTIFSQEEVGNIVQKINCDRSKTVCDSSISQIILKMFNNLDSSDFKSHSDYLYIKEVIGKVIFGQEYAESEKRNLINNIETQIIVVNINPFLFKVEILTPYFVSIDVTHIIQDVEKINFLYKGNPLTRKNKKYEKHQYYFDWRNRKFKKFKPQIGGGISNYQIKNRKNE